MQEYIDIVKHVLENGQTKKPVRKDPTTGKWIEVDGGISTLACANVLFSHDMVNGFPLLTTKKMAWKSIRVELEGFIRGITEKSWFQDRGCKIWNEWANPVAVEKLEIDFEHHVTMMLEGGCPQDEIPDKPSRKETQASEDDLGPIYGYQWRKFNRTYTEGGQPEDDGDYTSYTDQLKSIVDTLLENPMDRRMVCSAWNPNQIHMMALPPCHWGWNVTVIGDELNLFWVQRSCDLMLGVPFNIASYALLLELLARTARLKPGNLSGMLVDCHIYENQIDAAKIQITREPRPLPRIELIRTDPLSKVNNESFNIFDWSYNDVHLMDYNPLDRIDFGAVAV